MFAAEKRSSEDQPNDPKKAKVESESAVVHARNIPIDCTELELVNLGQPFGTVVNVLVLKGKTQAFLEMESPAVASQMLAIYNQSPPYIRTKPIMFQFSKHAHISNSKHTPDSLQNLATMPPMTGKVLHCEVQNLYYQVTIDTLHHVFSKFGPIARIITFTKNGVFQALVEFVEQMHASAARQLNGQNIYSQCCTLKVQGSKLPKLNVKYNSEKSRDYVNQVPESMAGVPPPGSALSLNGGYGQPPGAPAYANSPGGSNGGYNNSYGQQDRYNQYPPQQQFGGLQPLPFEGQHGQGHGGYKNPNDGQHGCVLLLNNLDEEKITPDILFTLIGVYADVARVKIMYNKKSSALVQVMDPQQASIAINHLEGVSVFGKPLSLTLSKHSSVAVSRNPEKDAESSDPILTKDFSDSKLHRFRKHGSRNFANIVTPSATLHVSNIPEDTTEERLKEILEEQGLPPMVGFRFFEPKDPKPGKKMALIDFGTIENAVTVLIALHDYLVDDKLSIRISFSKSDV